MDFELVGELTDIETIAAGRGIRDLPRLRRLYDKGYRRKMKGSARIRLRNGRIRRAELHCTGMKRMASARRSSSVRGTSTRSRKPATSERRFVVCVRNDGYEASLERNKIYASCPTTRLSRMAIYESSTRVARTICSRPIASSPSRYPRR